MIPSLSEGNGLISNALSHVCPISRVFPVSFPLNPLTSVNLLQF